MSTDPYYADFDEETGLWCVFSLEDDNGFAYSSWGSEEGAEFDAELRNESWRINNR